MDLLHLEELDGALEGLGAIAHHRVVPEVATIRDKVLDVRAVLVDQDGGHEVLSQSLVDSGGVPIRHGRGAVGLAPAADGFGDERCDVVPMLGDASILDAPDIDRDNGFGAPPT